jgi:hypothetical protein
METREARFTKTCSVPNPTLYETSGKAFRNASKVEPQESSIHAVLSQTAREPSPALLSLPTKLTLPVRSNACRDNSVP